MIHKYIKYKQKYITLKIFYENLKIIKETKYENIKTLTHFSDIYDYPNIICHQLFLNDVSIGYIITQTVDYSKMHPCVYDFPNKTLIIKKYILDEYKIYEKYIVDKIFNLNNYIK